jgi:hypothetical protein
MGSLTFAFNAEKGMLDHRKRFVDLLANACFGVVIGVVGGVNTPYSPVNKGRRGKS